MSITIRYDFRVVAALFMAFATAACATVDAAPASLTTAEAPTPRIEIGGGRPVRAPIGFLDFCRRSPADCGAADADAAVVVAQASSTLYWSAVFNPASDPQAVPASLSRPAASGRFDWSGVFATAPVAPPVEAAPSELHERVVLAEGLTISAPVGKSGAPPAEIAPMPVKATVERESEQWKTVLAANRLVNRSIKRGSDEKVYGAPDYWEAGLGGRGDCEDYVLTKRRVLIERGVPADALSIALVRTRWGEDHAVLLVATPEGEFVLDNLSPWVSRWDSVDYDWRQRQLPGDVFNWVDLTA